jgi:hypothetical protein
MQRLLIAAFVMFVCGAVPTSGAIAANAITFGSAAKSCGGGVVCSTDGTHGYLNSGSGQAFRASTIQRWFQIDVDGRSHLKGQPREPTGGSGTFLVVNDTGRPISLYALTLGTDFNSRTPGVHACAGARLGKPCNQFTADDGTNLYKAQLSGADWDSCITGKSKLKRLCVGNPAEADFTPDRATFSWRAKPTGAILSGATFSIDFSNWNSDAWADRPPPPFSIVMISVDANGNPGNALSIVGGTQVWTADSNNALFESEASNLPGGSSSNITEYIYNVPATMLTPIPTSLPAVLPGAIFDSISGDGSLVGYSGGDNGGGNVYLYNTSTQTTLTLAPGGDRANQVLLDENASYYVFDTIDDNNGGVSLVWVYDVATGSTTQMLAPGGVQPNNAGCQPTATSGTGELVVLTCPATNLVPGIVYSADYEWDQFANAFTDVTTSTNGQEGMPAAGGPVAAITPDGSYVAINSAATDLVPGGTTGTQSFAYDNNTQAIQLVSAAGDGTPANGSVSYASGISSDGRYVPFSSNATNLGCEANGDYWAYVKDLQTGELQCLTDLGTSDFNETISGNGQYVEFSAGGQVYMATLQ